MVRVKALNALKPLMHAATSLMNPELQQAKQDGKKIVGFMYQELPEEILTAAGCVPYFIRGTGSDGTEFADAYFRHLTCNYTRHTFNQILDGKLDFLDGAVFYNACDHSRRIYDNWKLLPDNPVYHFLYIPKTIGKLAKDFYREEVAKFIEATEKRFGVEITKERLAEAIRLHNRVRLLQRELYKMQEGDAVYLSGTELMMVMLAGISMPRDVYADLLEKLIAELKDNGETFTPAIRLLYVGGHLDNRETFELLESQGGQIVVDNLGFGSRACAELIREEGDPLEAIIDYYFDEKPAATRQMMTHEERLKRTDDLVAKYRIDGVITARLYMCDIWAFEQFMLRKHLTEKGVPILELELDYTPEGEGQTRTRVQAFVESIRDRRH